MNQEALYYQPSPIYTFEATILSCQPFKHIWRCVLSIDGFYPEGGGQPSDRGFIMKQNEKITVLDVQEEKDKIYVSIDKYIEPGSVVECCVDQRRRLRLSQNHSGEHIVSGLIHKNYGFDNVGFHMECQNETAGVMTVDINGLLNWNQLMDIEQEANEAIWQDQPVKTMWLASENDVFYRSKKSIDGLVRVVQIGEFDSCACCGTHVSRTGQIGSIKILSAQPHRKGTRFTMICGLDAYLDARIKHDVATKVGQDLSVSAYRAPQALQEWFERYQKREREFASFRKKVYALKAKQAKAGNVYSVWEEGISSDEIRNECDYIMKHSQASLVFVFSENERIRFALGSLEKDVRPILELMKTKIPVRAGGQKEMVQGTIEISKDEMIAWIHSFQENFE